MFESNQKMNFHYKCQINDVIYNIQLFNIQHEKIKIMIDTKNFYSDDYIGYSNIYTLIQFQEINRYYILFQNIDELFDDLSQTIKEKNFSITNNGKTMTFIIKVIINQNEQEISFTLEKNNVIDLYSQKGNPYYYNNNISSKNSEMNKIKMSLEKSKRNLEISDINELKTVISDLKDRITVLEASQNNEIFQNKIIYDKNNYNNNNNITYNNDNFEQGLNNILMRLNKLEKDNINKDKIIEKLEQKLIYYQSFDKSQNNNIENDNNYINYNTPQNPNNNYLNYNSPKNSHTLYKSEFPIKHSYFNYELQSDRQFSFTLDKNKYLKKFNNYPRLKQSKSQLYKNYNNENMSLYSKGTKKSNFRSNSYNDKYTDKKISFKDINKSYGEKDTFRSNKISYPNDMNSAMSNYSNTKDKNFDKYLFYKEKLGIPLVPREDLKKYVNSRIIFTKNELRLLKSKFSKGNKKLHVYFDLLYRASIDGDFEEVIKSKTEDKEKTLTLFYTYEGARFGVFINKKKSNSIFKGTIYKEIPGTSFIVSLNYSTFFDISSNKNSKENNEGSLCFGKTFYLNSNGSNWLINTPKRNFLKKKCIIGNQKSDYMFFNPEILVGNKNEYHIKDVEIFHIVFEKDQ